MAEQFRRVVRCDRGQNLLEYSLLLALVVLVVIAGLQLFGVSLTRSYEGTSSALSGSPGGGGAGGGTGGGGNSAGGAAGNAGAGGGGAGGSASGGAGGSGGGSGSGGNGAGGGAGGGSDDKDGGSWVRLRPEWSSIACTADSRTLESPAVTHDQPQTHCPHCLRPWAALDGDSRGDTAPDYACCAASRRRSCCGCALDDGAGPSAHARAARDHRAAARSERQRAGAQPREHRRGDRRTRSRSCPIRSP